MSKDTEAGCSGKYCTSLFDDRRFTGAEEAHAVTASSVNASSEVDDRFATAVSTTQDSTPYNALYESSDDRFAPASSSQVVLNQQSHQCSDVCVDQDEKESAVFDLSEDEIKRIVKAVLNQISK